ncbi:MAG: hypothetical protein AAF589_02025 [Planctomycetota bacterium]
MLVGAFFAAACSQSPAALIWVGTNVSLFNESNWLDDNGQTPPANSVNPSRPTIVGAGITGVFSTVTADTGGTILISDDGPASPSAFIGNFSVGDNDLIVSGGQTLASSLNPDIPNSFFPRPSGINLTSDGPPSPSSENQLMSILEGSTVNVQFIVNFDITMDGGSFLQLRGGGTPLNVSTIDVLDTASTVQYDAEDTAAFLAEHAANMSFAGAPLEFGADPLVVEPGDNAFLTEINAGAGVIVSFIPEPSALILAGLPMLACLLRRK